MICFEYIYKSGMQRLPIRASAICIIFLYFAVAVNSDERNFKKLEQHYNNVLDLRRDMDSVPTKIEVLLKKSEQQIKFLQDLESKSTAGTSTNAICERMSRFLEVINRKHNSFRDTIVIILEEMHNKQSIMVQKILNRRNCQIDNTSTEAVSQSLSEVNEKIENFEEKLKNFGLQQNLLESQSSEHMNLLQEISEKLIKQQQKFENFEKQLPTLIQKVKEIELANPRKLPKLPMNIFMGATQNSMKKTKCLPLNEQSFLNK